MKPAARFPKKRHARPTPIPQAKPAPADLPAVDAAAEMARRASLCADATDWQDCARRLVAAGEMTASAAVAMGVSGVAAAPACTAPAPAGGR